MLVRTNTEQVHLLCLAGFEPSGIASYLNDLLRIGQRRWTTARVERLLAHHPIPCAPPEPVWTYADQTRVALRGHITGDGALARRLRGDIESLVWRAVSVGVYAEPAGTVDLDLNEPMLVYLWARHAARQLGVAFVSGPDLTPPRETSDHEPGRVY